LRLSHPRYAKQKHYEVLVQGRPSPKELAVLRAGVVITEDDGRSYKTSSAQIRLLRQAGNDSWLALTIHEGRKRQVRRMLATVGHPVRQLMRVGLGSLTLKGVPTGKWRYLTEAEVTMLCR
jgi:pseudouridine synthase